MSKLPPFLLAVALLALVASASYVAFFRTGAQSTSSTISSGSPSCESSLWDHVYNPSRLQVLNQCITATGTVDEIRNEADGDLHILLNLDAGQASLLNQGNISDQNGDLVLEAVCVGSVSQADAVEACINYTNAVSIPNVGDHVSVTGSFVFDAYHGWNEIHPVSNISKLS